VTGTRTIRPSVANQECRQTPALVETLPAPLCKSRILITAGDARLRITLSIVLRQHGFSVRLTAGVAEALELYRREPQDFDLLVLDADTPEANLTEAVEALRAVNPHVKLCLLTGTDAGSAKQLARLNPVRVFSKPLELGTWVQDVRSMVSQPPEPSAVLEEMPALQPVPAQPPGDERRAFVRYRCGRSTSCQPVRQGGLGERWQGQLQDVSAGGLKLVLGRRFEPGSLLCVEPADADGDPSHSLLARVVRVVRESGGQWSHGCAFPRPLAEDDLKSLIS